MLPKNSSPNLIPRKNQSLRQLPAAKNKAIYFRTGKILKEHHLLQNGATGSRLLSDNNALYEIAERLIAKIPLAETALIFNSGYDANVDFFSCAAAWRF